MFIHSSPFRMNPFDPFPGHVRFTPPTGLRSDDAKSLIRWMLKMNPRDRYSAARRPQWRSSRIELPELEGLWSSVWFCCTL